MVIMAVIIIQLLGNNPTGIKIIELSNWKGRTFVIPRSSLSELRDQSDLNQPGVYYLVGEGEEKPKLYIGQSENCFARLTSHDRKKEEEEWDTAIVFTGGLHSTYIRYLESISVRLARESGRYEVENRTDPTEALLTGANKETADDFFKDMRFLTEFSGFNFFWSAQNSIADQATYYLNAEGANASARLLTGGSLDVIQGSLARIRETNTFFGWSQAARRKFLEDGTLVDNGDGISYRFTRNVEFSSPSAAATTIADRSINGWTAWKDSNDRTLDENVRQ